MSEARQAQRMTADEFLVWQADQDRNYELVDGIPVLPAKAMTGATRRHDRVTVNIIRSLANQLMGSPCFPSTADIAVANPNGNLRRPDITIDCGATDDASTKASDPRIVIEVLSPSTMRFDRFVKIEEYKANSSILVILVVDTEAEHVIVWRRGDDSGWSYAIVKGRSETIALPEVGADLALGDVYSGVRSEQSVSTET